VITTDYGVVIERLVKGISPPEGVVTVSVLGGRVGYSDGSVAEIRTPGLPRPIDGQRYLLFLRRTRFLATPEQLKSAKGHLYAPVLTSQGMFQFTEAKGIAPRARRGHPLRKRYESQPEQLLIDDVTAAVAAERRKQASSAFHRNRPAI
jgi:hypothetical protein